MSRDNLEMTGEESGAKGVPSFLSYFKTLSKWPGPGNRTQESRSAGKRSTDWANPAAVKLRDN